ncbi:MAG: hypothetical protein FGM24_05070 [Candidatus Kapabacteria bacterium]|nr:hypothetical protein [Candidatus Kapabacteria bacterium]
MSFWFHVAAARSVLGRRRRPVARMVLTSMAATLWCLVGGIWALATWRETQTMASQTIMELFVPDGVTPDATSQILTTLRAMPAFASVRVVDAETVAQIFQKDIGIDQGLVDIMRPPTIIRCTMRPDAVTVAGMTMTSTACRSAFPLLSGAYWSRDYVYAIERRRSDIMVMGSVAGLLSVVMFVLAILYAFRAELHQAESDLKVGVLLGASPSFVAMPHVLVSSAAGTAGLAIAGGLLAAAWPQITARASWLTSVQPHEIVMMAATLAVAGLVVCWWQSISTVSRRTRTKRS